MGVLSPKMKLRNFLTFIIRHVIFKKRYKDFGGKEIAKIALREIIKAKIKNELIDKWVLHRSKGTQEDFDSKYIENMFVLPFLSFHHNLVNFVLLYCNVLYYMHA